MPNEDKIKKLKRLHELEKDPVLSTYNELEAIDERLDKVEEQHEYVYKSIQEIEKNSLTQEDISSAVSDLNKKIEEVKGIKGDKGEDGKDYILTPEDKQEIASSIKVPIVEKIVEKTEVVREQPIIKTEIVKEVKETVTEDVTGETIVNRINDLPTNDQALKIDAKHIKNLPSAIQQYGGVTPQKVLDLIAENPSASTFLDLTDTPDSYTGQGAKVVKVKADGSGLEFGVATQTGSMTFIIGDGDTAITAGTTGYLPQMPYGGTITGWYLTETSSTPVSGSIVIDVWKDTTGNYPPTVLDTIAGSEKPTLSTATNNKDETLTTWTTTVTAGDCIGFKVDSVTDCKKVTLIIKFNKS